MQKRDILELIEENLELKKKLKEVEDTNEQMLYKLLEYENVLKTIQNLGVK